MADQQPTSEQSPQIFAFDDQMVRTIDQNGEAWFVATDIAKILEYNVASAMTRHLDEDEKGVSIRHTPGGDQELIIISEAGLYSAIFRSRKEEAKRFKRWVTHEVLPAIRMTGKYELGDKPATQPNLVSLQQQSLKLIAALKTENNKDIRRLLYSQLEVVLDKQGLEAPALNQIGSDAPDSPPEAERFWNVYRELRKLGIDLNHHKDDRLVAINLKEFEKISIANGLRLPSLSTLRKALRHCRKPKFVDANYPVHSALKNKSVKAWVFELDQPGQEV